MEHYIQMSMELHLFFARIMKEHSIFMEASFQQKDCAYKREAEEFKVQFENVLETSLQLSNGAVSNAVLESGELVTPFTLRTEEETQQLTGIAINKCITQSEQQMVCGCGSRCTRQQVMAVQQLNQRTACLLGKLIEFKEKVLKEVKCCRLYTANYPLLLEHIIREAKLYQMFLSELLTNGRLSPATMKKKEQFWNQIMMEHALFIRGLLDPTETALIGTANEFANEYAVLLQEACGKNNGTMDGLTQKSKELTCRYRDFKAAGTKGISECEISSVILPLLADHVLREANHYLRLLNS